jgi:hypothetical protein
MGVTKQIGDRLGDVGAHQPVVAAMADAYMLQAIEKLAAAQRRDPGNKYVQNNLQLLEDSYRKGKAIE